MSPASPASPALAGAGFTTRATWEHYSPGDQGPNHREQRPWKAGRGAWSCEVLVVLTRRWSRTSTRQPHRSLHAQEGHAHIPKHVLEGSFPGGKRTALVAMTVGKKEGRLRNSASPPPPWTPAHESTARTHGHQTPKAGRRGAPHTPVPEPGEKESHKRGGS